MKVPNKLKLQQIAFNHSSDIDFQDLMNLCKHCAAKTYSLLVMKLKLEIKETMKLKLLWPVLCYPCHHFNIYQFSIIFVLLTFL